MGRYNSLIKFEHLKNFKSTEGYWSTEDCIEVAKDILSITNIKSMLEIGFNIGHSASIWLELGVSKLNIIDINTHPDTEPAVTAVVEEYDSADISWWFGDSTSEEAFLLDFDKVEAAFIDGEHSYIAALSDSYLGILNGAKWLIYDDVIENHENGIHDVIQLLVSIGLISIVKEYDMTWTEQGKVILTKVNYVNV
jgi:predicted O-methyltransferase YrrM